MIDLIFLKYLKVSLLTFRAYYYLCKEYINLFQLSYYIVETAKAESGFRRLFAFRRRLSLLPQRPHVEYNMLMYYDRSEFDV